jgi:hypothetical protein
VNEASNGAVQVAVKLGAAAVLLLGAPGRNGNARNAQLLEEKKSEQRLGVL